jgi:hypothetical protein
MEGKMQALILLICQIEVRVNPSPSPVPIRLTNGLDSITLIKHESISSKPVFFFIDQKRQDDSPFKK